MFTSEVMDTSTVVSAGDDDPADLCVADGANVAVISGCTVCLADVARLPVTVSAIGEAVSSHLPRRKGRGQMVSRRKPQRRGHE
jgi:hypothetical protein